MDKMIQNHLDIIDRIKKYILEHHTTQNKFIELIEGNYYEGYSKQFQIKFPFSDNDYTINIYLNFEIPDKNHSKLWFESTNGPKIYSKKNNYENLLNEIDSYIVFKKDKYIKYNT